MARISHSGVVNAEKIEQDFINVLRGGKFNISIVPKCFKYSFDNKIVLAFYIPLSNKKPIYYGSPANTFIRTGSGDQKATNVEIDAMSEITFGIS
jgi:ATP-dependent DNA helicase RecG